MNKKFLNAFTRQATGGRGLPKKATARRESPLVGALMKKPGVKRASPMKRSGAAAHPLTRALTKKAKKATAKRRAAGSTMKKKSFMKRSKR